VKTNAWRLGVHQPGGPSNAAGVEPSTGEAFAAVGGEQVGDELLVGFRRRGREGERDLAKAELEQAVAAARLAVVVALEVSV